jgi:hypothetical protein
MIIAWPTSTSMEMPKNQKRHPRRRRWRALQILFWVTLVILVAHQLGADLGPVNFYFRQALDYSSYPLASTSVRMATDSHLWTTFNNTSTWTTNSSLNNYTREQAQHENDPSSHNVSIQQQQQQQQPLDDPLASTSVRRATHPHLWTTFNTSSWTTNYSLDNSTPQQAQHENEPSSHNVSIHQQQKAQNLSKLPTILAQLSGEMGNNLSFLIHARGLQYMLL